MKAFVAGMLVVFFMVTLSCPRGHADEYTRIGAEMGGNASGEITPFEGGKGLRCPSDYKLGQFLPDPYKGEKPLLRIDHTNVAQHKERLAPGQIARLKRNENFYMNVYPTHRNLGR